MNEPLAPLNLIVLVATVLFSWQGFKSERFLEQHLFSTTQILRGREYLRLITSGFLHADWIHLVFNMMSLFAFGAALEAACGAITYGAIYFASIVGGGLLSLVIHRHHDYRALGASGGVCGIIFAAIFLVHTRGIYIFPLPFAIPAWLYAIFFILFSYYGIRSSLGNVGHDAHLGGALVGLLTAAILHPMAIRAHLGLFAAIVILSVALLIHTCLNPLHLPAANPFTHAGRLALIARWRAWRSTRYERQRQTALEEDEQSLDALLDKISRQGINRLSASEKRRLDALSKRRRSQ